MAERPNGARPAASRHPADTDRPPDTDRPADTKRSFVIGLTGNIATGKSLVGQTLSRLESRKHTLNGRDCQRLPGRAVLVHGS